jgi:hypothetical protein
MKIEFYRITFCSVVAIQLSSNDKSRLSPRSWPRALQSTRKFCCGKSSRRSKRSERKRWLGAERSSDHVRVRSPSLCFVRQNERFGPAWLNFLVWGAWTASENAVMQRTKRRQFGSVVSNKAAKKWTFLYLGEWQTMLKNRRSQIRVRNQRSSMGGREALACHCCRD